MPVARSRAVEGAGVESRGAETSTASPAEPGSITVTVVNSFSSPATETVKVSVSWEISSSAKRSVYQAKAPAASAEPRVRSG